MLDRLLPQRLDNAYRGATLALWLFALVVLMKGAIGVNSILNGHTVAIAADGIPLDTYTPAGARAVVSMFAIWGFAQVMIGLMCVLALVRYRAAVPLLFVLLLMEHLGRRLIVHVLPIDRTGTPPGPFVNLALLAVMVLGLALSLWPRGERPDRA